MNIGRILGIAVIWKKHSKIIRNILCGDDSVDSRAKTCLVLGQGSIGKRHARILRGLQHRIIAVSKHANPTLYPYTIYPDLSQALQENSVDYAVIASATDRHLTDIQSLIKFGFSGILLVEKPLFTHFHDLFPNHFSAIYGAYNLRFHPLYNDSTSNFMGSKSCLPTYMRVSICQIGGPTEIIGSVTSCK